MLSVSIGSPNPSGGLFFVSGNRKEVKKRNSSSIELFGGPSEANHCALN
jgi:hypothetical protein